MPRLFRSSRVWAVVALAPLLLLIAAACDSSDNSERLAAQRLFRNFLLGQDAAAEAGACGCAWAGATVEQALAAGASGGACAPAVHVDARVQALIVDEESRKKKTRRFTSPDGRRHSSHGIAACDVCVNCQHIRPETGPRFLYEQSFMFVV